jgi:hypothetical protein
MCVWLRSPGLLIRRPGCCSWLLPRPAAFGCCGVAASAPSLGLVRPWCGGGRYSLVVLVACRAWVASWTRVCVAGLRPLGGLSLCGWLCSRGLPRLAASVLLVVAPSASRFRRPCCCSVAPVASRFRLLRVAPLAPSSASCILVRGVR